MALTSSFFSATVRIPLTPSGPAPEPARSIAGPDGTLRLGVNGTGEGVALGRAPLVSSEGKPRERCTPGVHDDERCGPGVPTLGVALAARELRRLELEGGRMLSGVMLWARGDFETCLFPRRARSAGSFSIASNVDPRGGLADEPEPEPEPEP